jgi:PKD repeat protein
MTASPQTRQREGVKLMNSIRHAVPNVIVTARCRATRLARAATLFAAVLVGAVSCADGGLTEPLLPASPVAGLKASYDSVAPMEQKLAELTSVSRMASLRASASASGSGSLTNVNAIAFAAEAGPFANQLPACDDCVFGGTTGFPVGFAFNYYGQNRSSFWVSTNGFVAFQSTPNGCCHGMGLPVFDEINHMIALAWVDLVPQRGQISFETRGEAPNRRLIVNYANVPVFNEGGRTVTAQLILYERTNVIELHTTSQPSMTRHRVTQGAENQPATEAAFVQGRVASGAYSLTNDAVRFSGEPVNAVPTAIAGGNAGTAPNKYYEGVEGVAVEFKGSGVDLDNDPLTYSWDFNDDGVADAARADTGFTFADNGVYSALLTVSDGRGGVGQARVEVVIKNAEPVVNVGSDVRLNAGETANFSGQFSDKGVNDAPWGWTYNLGAQGSYYGNADNQAAALTGSHRFCKAGSFPVKLTVVDKDGGSGSDELVVTVDVLPVQIDVNPNMIVLNDNGNGMVIVRIYSRQGLDATALNPSSIKLTNGSGRGTSLARTGGGLWTWHPDADLNGDGLLDVVAHFRRDEMLKNGDLDMSTTKLTLKGEVGECGDALGSAPVRVKVHAKPASAASSLQPTGPAATPIEPSNP